MIKQLRSKFLRKKTLSSKLLILCLIIYSSTSVATIGPFAYIAGSDNSYGGIITVIDTTDNSKVGQPIRVGRQPSGIVISPDGSRAYVNFRTSNSISVIKTNNHTVVDTITVGSNQRSITISPDGQEVYVVADGNVAIINTNNNEVTTINVAELPQKITITPDGSRLFVTTTSNTIYVFNTEDHNLVATIPFSFSIGDIVAHPEIDLVYVIGGIQNNSITAINTENYSTNVILRLEEFPSSLGINSNGSRLYVTNPFNNYSGRPNHIWVANLDGPNPVPTFRTIEVGYAPSSIAVSLDDNQVYVANGYHLGDYGTSNNVSVINANTNQVSKTIQLDYTPTSVAIGLELPSWQEIIPELRYAINSANLLASQHIRITASLNDVENQMPPAQCASIQNLQESIKEASSATPTQRSVWGEQVEAINFQVNCSV